MSEEVYVPNTRIEVAPGSISDELEKIADAAADWDKQNQSLQPRVRATLSNLIILSSENCPFDRNEAVEKLIEELSYSYPSRFLVVNYSHGQKFCDSLQASVSSRCVLAHSGSHICSEEVYLSTNENSIQYLPNLLLSLFIPDAPVVLAVLGDLSIEKNEYRTLLQRLVETTDKVLADSTTCSGWDEMRHFFSNSKFEKQNSFCDLGWLRLKRWRELVSEQFDSQGSIKSIDNLKRIEISFEQHEKCAQGSLLESVLFASWIIAKLDCELLSVLVSDDKDKIEFSLSGNREIDLSIVGLKTDNLQSDSSLAKINFSMESDGKFCEILIERLFQPNLAQISLQFSSLASGSDNSCEILMRKVPLDMPPREKLFNIGLNESALDSDYREIMIMLGEILNQIKSSK